MVTPIGTKTGLKIGPNSNASTYVKILAMPITTDSQIPLDFDSLFASSGLSKGVLVGRAKDFTESPTDIVSS